MIKAKEIDGELWIKASDHHQAIKEALAQTQEPVAFAGIEMWVGGARITKHITKTEFFKTREAWLLMKYSADWCLAKLKEKNTNGQA